MIEFALTTGRRKVSGWGSIRLSGGNPLSKPLHAYLRARKRETLIQLGQCQQIRFFVNADKCCECRNGAAP